MNSRKVLVLLLVWLVGATGCAASSHQNSLDEMLNDAARPAEDKARDAGRKPVEVVSFLGIKPGMKVLDLLASGGYYTEVLSWAVGPTGTVYCHNNPGALDRRGGAPGRELAARLDGRLTNVVRVDAGVRDMGIAPSSLDAITIVLNFHDIYNGNPQVATGMLQMLAGLLKPGGFIAIIDHAGNPGADNAGLHRIDPALVRAAVSDAGLVIKAEGSVLANPADDHTKMVFAPGMRGATDRFIFKVTAG